MRNNDTDLEKGTDAKLEFSANVECPDCALLFEGFWVSDAIDIEQITDPPEGEQLCPNCGCVFEETYPGWSVYNEA